MNKSTKAMILKLKVSTPEAIKNAKQRGDEFIRAGRCTCYVVMDEHGQMVASRDLKNDWN